MSVGRSLIINFALVVAMLFIATECTEAAEIVCKYNFGTKQITVNTKKTGSYSNKFSLDGIKYSVFIKNINDFNELEDYIVMENRKNHRITYVLNCNK